MNRDALLKTTHSCVLCQSFGYHTYADGCALAGRRAVKMGEAQWKKILESVDATVARWQAKDREREKAKGTKK